MSLFSVAVFALLAALPNPVFVYELGDITPAAQARIVSETGFAGTVFDHAKDIDERIQALDNAHLQFFYLWLTADISNGQITYEPGMDAAIRALKGRSTVIWLAITGRGGEGGEVRAIEASRHIADLAAASNLRVALYPHYGFYLPKFRDVMRVAEAADRSNLGITFNLCHELRSGFDQDFPQLLHRAMPRLFALTINGADNGGHEWNTLIQPLGQGTYHTGELVRTITQAGYRGPVGLQCYGIKADPRTYLPGALDAWHTMSARAAK